MLKFAVPSDILNKSMCFAVRCRNVLSLFPSSLCFNDQLLASVASDVLCYLLTHTEWYLHTFLRAGVLSEDLYFLPSLINSLLDNVNCSCSCQSYFIFNVRFIFTNVFLTRRTKIVLSMSLVYFLFKYICTYLYNSCTILFCFTYYFILSFCLHTYFMNLL